MRLNQRFQREVDGVLLLDKPVGISSNQALQKAKSLFQAKKAGHTGSLDVLASGMLPICFGEATKFTQFLLNADKTYEAVALLGKRTVTGDQEGPVVEERSIDHLTREKIEAVLKQMIGKIQQIPPMYSALKRQGVPLYQLARQGIEVERSARTVTIYSIELLHWVENRLTLRVACSKGTYIRTLVEDIGNALNCGAYTFTLRRLTSGKFQADQMITLAELEKNAEKIEPISVGTARELSVLQPMETLVEALPAFQATAEERQRLQHGKKLEIHPVFSPGQMLRLYDSESKRFFGIGIIETPSLLASYRLTRQESFGPC